MNPELQLYRNRSGTNVIPVGRNCPACDCKWCTEYICTPHSPQALMIRIFCSLLKGCLPFCRTIRSETSGTNQGKMERHFSLKVNFQPDRSVPFTFRPKFRLHHNKMPLETRIFVNGTARFGRTRGPFLESPENFSGPKSHL